MSGMADADERIEQIVVEFENATIDAAEFDHEPHLLVGWRYLQHYSLLDSIKRYSDALRRLTRKLGVPSKYHETITWFYRIKTAERKAQTDWAAFKTANPDLFESNPSLVQQYYSESLLSSECARQSFVFPDLAA